MGRNIYVIRYRDRWAWKFETGIVQKLCKSREDPLFHGEQQARKYESDLYVEDKNGKFIKQKRTYGKHGE